MDSLYARNGVPSVPGTNFGSVGRGFESLRAGQRFAHEATPDGLPPGVSFRMRSCGSASSARAESSRTTRPPPRLVRTHAGMGYSLGL